MYVNHYSVTPGDGYKGLDSQQHKEVYLSNFLCYLKVNDILKGMSALVSYHFYSKTSLKHKNEISLLNQ